MTKKCLVTGVAGFIGSNLLTRLLREGWEVVGLDDLSHGFLRNVEPHLGNPRFRFVQADVRDRCEEPPVVSELHEVGSYRP